MYFEKNQSVIIRNNKDVIQVISKQSKSTPGIKIKYNLPVAKYTISFEGKINCKNDQTSILLWVDIKNKNTTVHTIKESLNFDKTLKQFQVNFSVEEKNSITTVYFLFRKPNINDIFYIKKWNILSDLTHEVLTKHVIMKKPKIYYLLGNRRKLYPLKSGDVINETNIIRAMSKYFDVYYNNQLFKPNLKDFGIKDIPIVIPKKGIYDLHYVRNNPNIFQKLPSPKIWFASPYIRSCYKTANIVSTLTDPWTNNLKNYKPSNYWGTLYKGNIVQPRKIITINQVIGNQYSPKQGHSKTNYYRKLFGNGFIIGHFGRVSNSCYPHSLIEILPKLKQKYPLINVVFSGNIQVPIKSPHIKVYPYIKYDDMPYVISACDLILFNHRTTSGHYAGSVKGLEAMMCKVPVLSPRFDARVLEFGEDYPLFYPYHNNNGRFPIKTEEKMVELISDIIENKDSEKYKKIREDIYTHAQSFNMCNSSEKINIILKDIIYKYE